MKLKSTKIGVIGLGYVGLPLAIEFSYQFPVIGFDINANRILDLNSGVDSTNEVEIANLKKANNIIFTSDADTLQDCNFYIVTVPTPINKNNRPDLGPLINASNLIATVLKKGDVVVYESTVYPGAHKAESIKVAEAAKVIENTQRDLNIALINELAMIFNLMEIDTESVLRAAETKWNFLPFRPGLVGGHCIGVDPYYLTHKAESLGYNPEIILAGRRLNDGMASFVSSQLVKLLAKKNIKINSSKILILGLSFKEDCPDIRNTKVTDIIEELREYNCKVSVYDPWVNKLEAKKEYGINLLDKIEDNEYDAIIIAVAHKEFKKMGIKKIRALGKSKHVVYDLKYLFSATQVDKRL